MESTVSDAPISAPLLSLPAYPTIKESWGIVGWHLLANIVVAIPAFWILRKGLSQSQTITGLAIAAVSQPALLLFLRWKAGVRWRPLQLKGHEQVWLYAALPILVLALSVVLSLLQYLHLPNWAGRFFRQSGQTPQLAFIIIVLTGPVFEELVVRGVILQGLLRSHRPWIAISQSALLFGIMHYNPAQSINAFLLGLVFGWLYYRTRSLWLCMAMHVLFNSLAFASIMAASFAPSKKPSILAHSPWLYTGLVLISVLVIGGILWRVYQTTSPVAEDAGQEDFLSPADGAELA
jgi:membrane protease YdiL (CAAX protease family)